MKPFNDRGSGLITVPIIKGLGRLASVASTFNKLDKNKSRYIKVYRFCLAPLVCLHG